MVAGDKNYIEMAKLLLDNGANTEAEDTVALSYYQTLP